MVGNSGSGKTTLAGELAARLGVSHLELDSVFHQPGWQELPTEEFRARVGEFVRQEAWVVDGNYMDRVGDVVWDRADTVVWLDLPRARIMRQVVTRTVRRAVLREELWNGNREALSNFTKLKPEQNIMVWAWTRHDAYRARYAAALADQAYAHLRFEVVRTPRDRRALLERVAEEGRHRASR